MFNKKTLLLFSLLLSGLLFSSSASSAPEAPENGQWAFSLMETVRLHSKPDRKSKFTEVSFNGKWIQAPSARRDENNNLWYRVKVNGREGWIFQTGIRLKMGAKSKAVSNIYKRTGKNIKDLPFTADSAKSSSEILGFNAIGMDSNSLRSKLGTPTMRETPPDEPDVNILSYELADRNMTLAFTLRGGNSNDYEVEFFELYEGKTGDNNDFDESESGNNFDDYEPESQNPQTESKNNNSTSKSNSSNSINSSERASEILEEKLQELDKISMNETLEYLSEAEINGEKCWVFSAVLKLNETGRFAVSESGNLYEFRDDEFLLLE